MGYLAAKKEYELKMAARRKRLSKPGAKVEDEERKGSGSSPLAKRVRKSVTPRKKSSTPKKKSSSKKKSSAPKKKKSEPKKKTSAPKKKTSAPKKKKSEPKKKTSG